MHGTADFSGASGSGLTVTTDESKKTQPGLDEENKK